MNSLLVIDAAEYNAATNRISSALQLLRDEMKSLRYQDVTLMRQFITMNDTIKSLRSDKKVDQMSAKREKMCAKRMRNRTRAVATVQTPTTPIQNWQISQLRLHSIPRRCDIILETRERRSSMSSEDESQDESLSNSVTSLEEIGTSTDSLSSAVPVFQSALFTRQRSCSDPLQSQQTSTEDENKVENISKADIKVWRVNCSFDECLEE